MKRGCPPDEFVERGYPPEDSVKSSSPENDSRHNRAKLQKTIEGPRADESSPAESVCSATPPPGALQQSLQQSLAGAKHDEEASHSLPAPATKQEDPDLGAAAALMHLFTSLPGASTLWRVPKDSPPLLASDAHGEGMRGWAHPQGYPSGKHTGANTPPLSREQSADLAPCPEAPTQRAKPPPSTEGAHRSSGTAGGCSVDPGVGGGAHHPTGAEKGRKGAGGAAASAAEGEGAEEQRQAQNRYCHFCQHIKIKKSKSMKGCSRPECVRRFCEHCLQVHLGEAAGGDASTWECPLCRKVCCCTGPGCSRTHRHCKAYRYRVRRAQQAAHTAPVQPVPPAPVVEGRQGGGGAAAGGV